MKKVTVIVIFFSILLIIPPLIMIFIKWKWFQETQYRVDYLLLLTNMAGGIYSIFTSIVLLLIILFLLRLEKEKYLKLIIILFCCLTTQQCFKVLFKNIFREPRPYVVWFESKKQISVLKFHNLNRYQRLQFIKKIGYINKIPILQIKHWQSENIYSFPSGHVLFASGWSLFFIILFWNRKQYILSIILIIWTEGIAFSRMLLGMHWPIDIISSIIISLFFTLFYYNFFLDKYFK